MYHIIFVANDEPVVLTVFDMVCLHEFLTVFLFFYNSIFTRASIYAIARICHGNSVCPSVCLSVCHTGGSVKNG